MKAINKIAHYMCSCWHGSLHFTDVAEMRRYNKDKDIRLTNPSQARPQNIRNERCTQLINILIQMSET